MTDQFDVMKMMDKAPNSYLDDTRSYFRQRFYDELFVTEFARLEALRCERYEGNFSLLFISFNELISSDNLPDKNETITFLKKFVSQVIETVRTCDVVGQFSYYQMMVVLPNTDYFGSLVAIRKLTRIIDNFVEKGCPLQNIECSRVTFPRDASTYKSLLELLRTRVDEKSDSLLHQLNIKKMLFWEAVEVLTQESQVVNDDYATFDIGAGQDFGESFIEKTNEIIIQEIGRSPQKKGIVYFGMKEILPNMPIKHHLAQLQSSYCKIFVVGQGSVDKMDIDNASPIFLADNRLQDTYFTFYLSEDMSYAVIFKESWGQTFTSFHTSDPHLVEWLIMKFQRDYSLQEQL